MSTRQSTSSDKTYRFISDPGHKENLSGRVRAACITCRRKKIKCSGQVPCGTCKEKGILCEGLIERKRPTKNHGNRTAQDLFTQVGKQTMPTGSPEVGSNFPEAPQADTTSRALWTMAYRTRPTNTLSKLKTASSSDDSGYLSGIHSASSDVVQHQSSILQSNVALAPNVAAWDESNGVSPTTLDSHSRSFLTHQASQQHHPTETIFSEYSPSTHMVPSATSAASFEWPDTTSQSTAWWSAPLPSDQTTTDLIHAARALERQAQSLRMLATKHDITTVDETRRQTIAFPVHSSREWSSNSPWQPSRQSAYDDLSLPVDRHTAANTTPMTDDIPSGASWWNLDMPPSTALGYH